MTLHLYPTWISWRVFFLKFICQPTSCHWFFLYPLIISENLWFCYIFRGYKGDPLREKCPYSEFFWTVFSLYAEKYWPEKLQIRTFFMQWPVARNEFRTGFFKGTVRKLHLYICGTMIVKRKKRRSAFIIFSVSKQNLRSQNFRKSLSYFNSLCCNLFYFAPDATLCVSLCLHAVTGCKFIKNKNSNSIVFQWTKWNFTEHFQTTNSVGRKKR